MHAPQLKRTHFHDFMLDVHSRLRKHAAQQDPLTHVANDISRKTKARARRGFGQKRVSGVRRSSIDH